jgi:hypothetical protein
LLPCGFSADGDFFVDTFHNVYYNKCVLNNLRKAVIAMNSVHGTQILSIEKKRKLSDAKGI